MERIQMDNFVFNVDIESTKKYYLSNSICSCPADRNLYAQIGTLSDELTAFLSDFGVDICRPDESADVERENYIDYLFVGYTVTGRIETEGIYETDIAGFHIKISRGDTPYDWFPNEQKEPCFFISVSGISLPWVLAEPFPNSEKALSPVSFKHMVSAFFKRKRDEST